ncbi:hypothetical protein SNEBB_007929 [Seison nebaliae]|nr:hypothetical protein SNEBB_007929 [Seison nebaliae]
MNETHLRKSSEIQPHKVHQLIEHFEGSSDVSEKETCDQKALIKCSSEYCLKRMNFLRELSNNQYGECRQAEQNHYRLTISPVNDCISESPPSQMSGDKPVFKNKVTKILAESNSAMKTSNNSQVSLTYLDQSTDYIPEHDINSPYGAPIYDKSIPVDIPTIRSEISVINNFENVDETIECRIIYPEQIKQETSVCYSNDLEETQNQILRMNSLNERTENCLTESHISIRNNFVSTSSFNEIPMRSFVIPEPPPNPLVQFQNYIKSFFTFTKTDSCSTMNIFETTKPKRIGWTKVRRFFSDLFSKIRTWRTPSTL